jgi:tRNA (guanine26-N2/guanine27-N2)-dimethyltransferase
MSSTVVPEGFRVHTENGARLLLPDTNEAFLNPIQEFNRDLSVASIRVWSEHLNELRQKRWNEKQMRKEQGIRHPKTKRPKGTSQHVCFVPSCTAI